MSKDYVSIVGKESNTRIDISQEELRENIVKILQTVIDPEIYINIYDLGFIYDILIDEMGNVELDMTLTAPGCPVADILPLAAANAVLGLKEVSYVKVALVWDPPWTIDKVSDDIKDLIEFF